MENGLDNVLDSVQVNPVADRRKLLPWWVKTFVWIFMVMSSFNVVIIAFAIFNWHAQLSIYGLSTNQPRSANGALIMLIFLGKGVTSWGLWTRKDWAVRAALADAGFGILLCCVMMVFDFRAGLSFPFRIELLFLAPYLIKMISIRKVWEAEPES